MTANEIITLLNAGYSKSEIEALEDSQDPGKEPAGDPGKDPAGDPQAGAVTLSDAQFKALIQQLNLKGASLDVPPETDLTAKLGEHFKELMKGTSINIGGTK